MSRCRKTNNTALNSIMDYSQLEMKSKAAISTLKRFICIFGGFGITNSISLRKHINIKPNVDLLGWYYSPGLFYRWA